MPGDAVQQCSPDGQQFGPQQLSPLAQAQTDAEQVSTEQYGMRGGQTWPQAPQFDGSVASATQRPLQQVSP